MSNGWNFQIINPPAAALASHAIITIASLSAKITPPSIRSFVQATITAASLGTIAVLGTTRLRLLYYPFSEQSYELGVALREAIQMYEQLRLEGAAWLGIVATQQGALRRDHPLLLAHFERTSHPYKRDPKWVIYSIIPADKKN